MSIADKFRELAAKVPGLGEFIEREDLREQDKRVREHTALRLAAVKTGIDTVKQTMLDNGQLSVLDDLDRLAQKVDRLTEQVRHAPRGYTGLLDRNQINEPELQEYLDTDLEILDRVEKVAEQCQAAAGAVETREDAMTSITSLKIDLTDLDTLIQARRNAAERLGI
jgi:hypothetical protein